MSWNSYKLSECMASRELGCGSPPKRCDFLQRNESFWEIPESGFASQNEECQMWANSSNRGGCYDCDSCKTGYLAKFQMDWQVDKALFVAILLILIVSTSLAFWTFSFRDESEHAREQRNCRNMVNA